jgi:hypothetical protein
VITVMPDMRALTVLLVSLPGCIGIAASARGGVDTSGHAIVRGQVTGTMSALVDSGPGLFVGDLGVALEADDGDTALFVVWRMGGVRFRRAAGWAAGAQGEVHSLGDKPATVHLFADGGLVWLLTRQDGRVSLHQAEENSKSDIDINLDRVEICYAGPVADVGLGFVVGEEDTGDVTGRVTAGVTIACLRSYR